ncbi:MAG: nucleoside triphosphate pyrophosphohydrolase [Clostridia bacterium]
MRELTVLGIDLAGEDSTLAWSSRPHGKVQFPPGETGEVARDELRRLGIEFVEVTSGDAPDTYCSPGCPLPLDCTAVRLRDEIGKERGRLRILQGNPLSWAVEAVVQDDLPAGDAGSRVLGPTDVAISFPHAGGTWVEGLWGMEEPGTVLDELGSFLLVDPIWVSVPDGTMEEIPRDKLHSSYRAGDFRLLYIPPSHDGIVWGNAVDRSCRRMAELMDVIYRLRAPGGCPWDRSHTHESLKPYLLEECHELLAAIDSGNPESVRDELGDVLLQVALHSVIGDEMGDFDLAGVAAVVREKMVHRHPHVFADARADSAVDVEASWERIKMGDGGDDRTLLDGVPTSLPALLQAEKVQSVASRVGFDWDHIDGAVAKLNEEVEEFTRAVDSEVGVAEEFGDVLFSLVNVARFLRLSPEVELLKTVAKFRRRLGAVQRQAKREGRDLGEMSLEEMDELWELQKECE